MAVYKSIMSGGGRNLFFALVDDKTDRVETIDLKKWLKANVRDNSSKDSKERVIKAILRNQKQFNKKVDFNMWAKKTKPSFEQTMDYFMKNGFVSNITKKGIKVYEGVETVTEATKPSIKMVNKFEPKEGIQIMAVKTLDGKTHFGGMVQRGRLAKIIPFVPNQSKSDVQKRALQIFDELEKDESVTEAKLKQKKLSQLKKGEKFVFNNKPYEFIQLYTDLPNAAKVKKEDGKTSVVSFGGGIVNKNTKGGFSDYLKQGGRIWDNVNPNESDSVTEDKGEVEKIAKQVGKNEIKFYDALSKVEKRLGSKYPKFLDTALKQLKQNPSKFKTNADKEEAIFQSVK